MFKVGSGSHVKKWNQQPLHIQTAGTEENGWVESLTIDSLTITFMKHI